MTALELLAPARNADIGIAAIDCGADAVYIAGPAYGARKDAGNSLEEVGRLCRYAHRFGVRILLTVNISLKDEELPAVHEMMLAAQREGVDAFIIRDERICLWDDIERPLHASTQCEIRSPERAARFEALGCSRVVLERQLPLERIKEIRSAISCEIEAFVHGALCVCYSGDCRLSQALSDRSADRGECIQACRSLYDLVDEKGRVLVKNKALLSLKDLNLLPRLSSLAEAGVSSFKIEGRLKNASYVKNVVREYSLALDALVAANPGKYRRSSFGKVRGGFEPDSRKTFNRDYTQLFLDGRRGRWSSMDTAGSLGEFVGTVDALGKDFVRIKPSRAGLNLRNGDGFAFAAKGGESGFRADVVEGNTLYCRRPDGLRPGDRLYRNFSAFFEKEMEHNSCKREISVGLKVKINEEGVEISARSEDGREVFLRDVQQFPPAQNSERILSMLGSGLQKSSGSYRFEVESVEKGDVLPLISSSYINSLRSDLAKKLDELPPVALPLPAGKRKGDVTMEEPRRRNYLMLSKYCIKYELGLCPKYNGAKPTGRLYLLNNSRRFALGFDCARCEMSVILEN